MSKPPSLLLADAFFDRANKKLGKNDKAKWQVLEALQRYNHNGTEPEFSDLNMRDLFVYGQRDVDENHAQWERKSLARSRAGKAGADAKWQTQQPPENDKNDKLSKNGKNGKNGKLDKMAKERKEKERKGMESKEKEKVEKKEFAPHVHLTEAEHADFIAKYGKPCIDWCIDKLDSYKESSGKTYKSDAGAIRQWVLTAYQKEHPETTARTSDDVIADRERKISEGIEDIRRTHPEAQIL